MMGVAGRISADLSTCEGLGMCEAMAPDYFEVGVAGTVTVLIESPSAEDRGYVAAAVEACPVLALKLQS